MKKILIIGYGNSTRSDDGAGIRAAELLAEKKIPGTEVRVMQQLHVELVEDFNDFDMTVLIDASEEASQVSLEKVVTGARKEVHSSHHLAPGILAGLSERLYAAPLDLYVCKIPGVSFDFGETLSKETGLFVTQAAEMITETIKEYRHARG